MVARGVMGRGDRVFFKGIKRSTREWWLAMGYDCDELDEYCSRTRTDRVQVTRKLLDYNYKGTQCTYSFRNHRKPKDLTDMRFGKLLVTKATETPSMWYVRCDCGCKRVALRRELLNGDMKSCGCGMRENREYHNNLSKNGEVQECRKLTYNGKTLTITEWARQPEQIELGIKRRNIYHRIGRGWSIEDALTRPCRNKIANSSSGEF